MPPEQEDVTAARRGKVAFIIGTPISVLSSPPVLLDKQNMLQEQTNEINKFHNDTMFRSSLGLTYASAPT